MVEKKIRYKRFKFKVKGLISIPTRPTLSYTFGKWNIHFSIDKKKAEMFSNFKTINFSQEGLIEIFQFRLPYLCLNYENKTGLENSYKELKGSLVGVELYITKDKEYTLLSIENIRSLKEKKAEDR